MNLNHFPKIDTDLLILPAEPKDGDSRVFSTSEDVSDFSLLPCVLLQVPKHVKRERLVKSNLHGLRMHLSFPARSQIREGHYANAIYPFPIYVNWRPSPRSSNQYGRSSGSPIIVVPICRPRLPKSETEDRPPWRLLLSPTILPTQCV
jgi:hypothetical protein